MIKKTGEAQPYFILDTDNTTYAFCITGSGHAEHLYYGASLGGIGDAGLEAIRQRREFELGNLIVYSPEYPTEMQEDMCLEVSSEGHGDVREPSVCIVHSDGCRSSDFIFESSEITEDPPMSGELPNTVSDSGKYEHLCVKMRDGDIVLELHYIVYPGCDVITRYAVLTNNGSENIVCERLMSMQLDIPQCGMGITSFHGAWAREMQKSTLTLKAGKFVTESRTGCSSNRANPFFMLHSADATEENGECFGFNLIYSGDHYSSCEVSAFGKTRVVCGMRDMSFVLGSGEKLYSPEAVMTYSAGGFTGQSINMHRFVREHIIRGKWKNKERPILLNSWEACYFNISEGSLTSLAKAGKELGMELFVTDDGWFAERNDDKHSLGDWDPSEKKLPQGLEHLVNRITSGGTGFGIWVEPEMINTESQLYRQHPEWAMASPGRLHSEGRNQRILDLSNPEVVDYLIEKMTRVFSSGNISYVKWDMNRIFSDAYSPYLSPEHQGEVRYRYICGLYRLMRELTSRFPDILFEGCASGGNRFDLGILCYFPQIWASDNTDAVCRCEIQEGYSYGYPQCCVAAHVSASPNHQTLRVTPLNTRFAAAAFGVLGYECDVRDLDSTQKDEIRRQTEIYKKWRCVLQSGQFYRCESGNVHRWICVSPDKKLAVGMILQVLAKANTQTERFIAKGLDPKLTYHFYSEAGRLDLKQFGSLINTVTPIHVKQDGLIHNVIARTTKMSTETEDMTVSGRVLMNSGVLLSPAFSGTGFNEKVRVFPDFSARLYFMEAETDG